MTLIHSYADSEFPCTRVRSACVQGESAVNTHVTTSLTAARRQPTPLYFMDEIDAALDFRNVSIIANYIKSKTEAAQL
jgi:hypothetical protein